MKPIHGIEFISRILCEDIRQEISNKFMLIGVYGRDIIVPMFPITVQVAIYFEIKIKKKGVRNLFMRLSGPGNDSAVMLLEIDSKESNSIATIISPNLAILMENEGEFNIAVSDDKETWETLISKTVILQKGD